MFQKVLMKTPRLSIFTNCLKGNTNLKVKKQYVKGGRFNVITKDNYPTKLLLAGHIDTVEPKGSDPESQLTPTIKGNKLYGLGSVDMLSGVASIISFLLRTKTKGVFALFYVDEEYDFLGMKKFIKDCKDISAEVCVITEPTNLKICNAHRGLIEVEYVIKGTAAHASRPNEGINAIISTVTAVGRLTSKLSKFKCNLVGVTSCNLSKIEGGLDIGTTNGKLKLSKGTNSVPDVCKVRLDIRPATTNLKENIVRNMFTKELKKTGCSLIYSDVIQDLGCLSVGKGKIIETIKAVKNSTGKTEFINPNDMGYGDGQMIFEEMKIPTLYFGAGPTSMCHKADEYVNISDLKKLDSFLDELYLLYQ